MIGNMQEQEIWKDVVGYEGLYQVSNLGRVRSFYNHGQNKTIILKSGHDSCGYLQVCLSMDKKTKCYKVHRLVALAFIPNPKGFREINHKDEDKTNNQVCNLEWCDRAYNLNYGSYASNMRLKMLNRKDVSKQVSQYTKDGKNIKDWVSMNEVERQLGFSHSNIAACCLGKRESSNGFVWKYKE